MDRTILNGLYPINRYMECSVFRNSGRFGGLDSTLRALEDVARYLMRIDNDQL
jgi:hypothetical protein